MEEKILEYYRNADRITDLTKYKKEIDWLPADPNVISQIVQGLIVHDCWLDRYQVDYKESHEYPQKTAYMEDILDHALKIDGSNLTIPRHPKDRVIACCREYATLMCAIFRAKGIPARSRCGFAIYFGWDGNYEDHWICEYWNGLKWIRWDAQIDPLQQSYIQQWGMGVKHFDPHNLKDDEFIPAGQAWKLCREGIENEMKFGIGCEIKPEWGIDSLHGSWFVRGQLLRDFAALNKIETVPYLVRICKNLDWKSWYLVDAKDNELTKEELELLDHIAELTCHPDENADEIHKLYRQNKLLQVPDEIIQR